jgi:hypothetical protein
VNKHLIHEQDSTPVNSPLVLEFLLLLGEEPITLGTFGCGQTTGRGRKWQVPPARTGLHNGCSTGKRRKILSKRPGHRRALLTGGACRDREAEGAPEEVRDRLHPGHDRLAQIRITHVEAIRKQRHLRIGRGRLPHLVGGPIRPQDSSFRLSNALRSGVPEAHPSARGLGFRGLAARMERMGPEANLDRRTTSTSRFGSSTFRRLSSSGPSPAPNHRDR